MSIPIIQFGINPVFVLKFPPHEGTKFTLKELHRENILQAWN